MKRKNRFPTHNPYINILAGITIGLLLALVLMPPAAVQQPPEDSISNMAYYEPGSSIPQLADHCAQTNHTYRLVVDPVGTDLKNTLARTSVYSPDGRYVAFDLDGSVYLQRVGEPELLKLEGNLTGSVKYLQWQPGGDRAIFHDWVSPTNQTLHLFDFSNGLKQAKQTVLSLSRVSDERGSWTWSPSGDYISWHATNALEIWSVSRRERVYQLTARILDTAWSYDGHYLAVVWLTDDVRSTYGIALVRADGTLIRSYRFAYSLRQAELFWFPNNQWVALLRQTKYDTRYIEMHSAFELEVPRAFAQTDHVLPTFLWAADGHQLLYWDGNADKGYHLQHWIVGRFHRETALDSDTAPVFNSGTYFIDSVDRLYITPDFSPSSPSAPLKFAHFTDSQIVVRNPDGSEPFVLADEVTSVRTLQWSPDGTIVAAVWLDEQDHAGGTTMHVSWTDSNMSHEVTLDGSEFFYLEWSPESDRMVVHYEDDNRVLEMVNVKTGERQIMRQDLARVFWSGFYRPDAFYTFHWQDRDGQFGYGGFDATGSRQFRVRYSIPAPWYVEDVFMAPNGAWAAIKSQRDKTTLIIARVDGSPDQPVRTNLRGLGDPIWSPNSNLIAFTEWNGDDQSISIADLTGDTVWTAPFPYEVREVIVSWQPCPSGE